MFGDYVTVATLQLPAARYTGKMILSLPLRRLP
jgi:hypothetical protein